MRILVYGDSNSWGFLDDGAGLRFANRWPVTMAEALSAHKGRPVTLIEECLPGRTTAYPDPQEGPEYNGLPYLKPALLSHAPLDVVLVMLGTNDVKARFKSSAEDIANNLISLAKIIRRAPVGHGKWREAPPPSVVLISPANLGNRANDAQWIRAQEWQDGLEKMKELPALLSHKIADLSDNDVHFIDANDAVEPSMRDPIHWAEACHIKMGKMMADRLASLGV